MTDKPENAEADTEDDIYGVGEPDDLDKLLDQQLDAAESNAADDESDPYEGLAEDAPEVEHREQVTEQEGSKRISESGDKDLSDSNQNKPDIDESSNKEDGDDTPADDATQSDDSESKSDTDDANAAEKDTDSENKSDDETDEFSTAMATLSEPVRNEIQAKITAHDEMAAAFEPFAAQLTGTTPAQALESLLKLNEFANNDRAGYLAWVAQQGGETVDPAKLVADVAEKLGVKVAPSKADDDSDDPADDDDLFIDPEVAALKTQIGQLTTKLDAMDQANTKAQKTAGDEAFNAFVNEVGEDGKALRPHFAKVADVVAALAAAKVTEQNGAPLQPNQLHSLYERAAWSDSEVRETLQKQQLAAQNAADAAKADAVKKAAAVKALRASKNIETPGRSAASLSDQNNDLDALLDDGLKSMGV